jgi:hypothetical protein
MLRCRLPHNPQVTNEAAAGKKRARKYMAEATMKTRGNEIGEEGEFREKMIRIKYIFRHSVKGRPKT